LILSIDYGTQAYNSARHTQLEQIDQVQYESVKNIEIPINQTKGTINTQNPKTRQSHEIRRQMTGQHEPL